MLSAYFFWLLTDNCLFQLVFLRLNLIISPFPHVERKDSHGRKTLITVVFFFFLEPTNIFEWLSLFGELVETLFNNVGGPLVHFVVLVGIASYSLFNTLQKKIWYMVTT